MPAEWFSDTSPEALEFYLNIYREMPLDRRLSRVFELCDFQQSLQVADVRATYPEAGEQEIFFRVAARRLGRNLMIEVYDWDPDLYP